MYAIVDIAGQQFKVEKSQKLYVHRLEEKEGAKVDFEKVLLIDDNGKITVGTPVVKNMVVSAKVLGHLKGDKVKVFKKKRRKGYQKLNGHRQYLTELLIEDIAAPKAKKAEKPKAESKPAEAKKETAKATETKKATKPAAKKETKAKDASKATKPAAKKTTTTKPAAKKSALKSTAAKKEAKPAAKKPAAKKTASKASSKKEDKKEE